ncbi:hypothetical protein EJ110_NYTH03161, partial [Nymphaea thermarum]
GPPAKHSPSRQETLLPRAFIRALAVQPPLQLSSTLRLSDSSTLRCGISISQTDMGYVDNGSEIMEHSQRKAGKKKRSLSETDLVDTEKNVDDDLVNEAMNSYNMDEPTMEEKLANLDLRDGSKMIKPLDENNLEDQLPSADSVGVLLQQALNADDRALLLECLYTQDEKLIESRTSNFESALKLSTCLDLLEISDDAVADISMKPAVVYEDKDDSDGELTDATETDEDGEESEE